jgi:ribosomal protein L31
MSDKKRIVICNKCGKEFETDDDDVSDYLRIDICDKCKDGK